MPRVAPVKPGNSFYKAQDSLLNIWYSQWRFTHLDSSSFYLNKIYICSGWLAGSLWIGLPNSVPGGTDFIAWHEPWRVGSHCRNCQKLEIRSSMATCLSLHWQPTVETCGHSFWLPCWNGSARGACRRNQSLLPSQFLENFRPKIFGCATFLSYLQRDLS